MLAVIAAASACKSDADEIWNEYAQTREANIAYYQEQAELLDSDGNKFYTKVVPTWDLGAEILLHYFNDRAETEGNLSPLLTSLCSVSYIGRNSSGVAFDSSFTASSRTANFRPVETITGWWIALENMRVGDSVRVVLPYTLAYGSTGTTNGAIGPFETLTFDIKLVDILQYEVK